MDTKCFDLGKPNQLGGSCDFSNQNCFLSQIEFLVSILEEAVKYNNSHCDRNEAAHKFRIFESRQEFSLKDFLLNFIRTNEIETATLIVAVILIDKLIQTSQIRLTNLNLERVIFAALIIAIKMNEDCVYEDQSYADSVGLDLSIMIQLESEFLEAIKWRAFVDESDFNMYSKIFCV